MTAERHETGAGQGLKILIHHRIASSDGQAVHIRELVIALRQIGCTVVIVGPAGMDRIAEGQRLPGISTLQRLVPRPVYEIMELGYSVRAFFRLLAAWRKHRPDALYERHNLFLLAGVWLKRGLGIPYIVEFNSPLALERERTGSLRLRAVGRWSEGAVLRSADRVLPVTQVLANWVKAQSVPEEKILVVPNAVDPDRFTDMRGLDEAKRAIGCPDSTVIGFVGYPRDWHRLDRAVDFIAAKRLELDLRLVVVGEGPGLEEVKARARALGVEDRLILPGALDREAVVRYLAAFDVALQPGVNDYASPLKLYEYMAAGRAILAPSSVNILEVLEDGRNAVLFDPEVPEDFQRGMERICADPALRQRLGATAKADVEAKNLTWHRNATMVCRVVRELT